MSDAVFPFQIRHMLIFSLPSGLTVRVQVIIVILQISSHTFSITSSDSVSFPFRMLNLMQLVLQQHIALRNFLVNTVLHSQG